MGTGARLTPAPAFSWPKPPSTGSPLLKALQRHLWGSGQKPRPYGMWPHCNLSDPIPCSPPPRFTLLSHTDLTAPGIHPAHLYPRAFAPSDPSAWNVLPLNISMVGSLTFSKTFFKSHLLSSTFPDHPFENVNATPTCPHTSYPCSFVLHHHLTCYPFS